MNEHISFREKLPTRTSAQDDVRKRIERGMQDVSAEEYDAFVLERGRDTLAVSVRDLVSSFVDTGKKYDALEVGAGTGISTKRLNEIENLDVIALDLREDYLEFAIRNGRIRREQAVVGSFSDLPFSDESFDLYVGVAVLNQREDIGKFYSEMSRVLREDGMVVIPWAKVKTESIRREMENFEKYSIGVMQYGDWFLVGKKQTKVSSRS